MNTKEAKDFLVDQAVEQAALDKEPLSEIEKRMMYFAENDPASCEDPLALNSEFEAECDTAEYEAKISRLLHHAYNRVKAEDPERLRNWRAAMDLLSKGDHYLPVLWDAEVPSDQPVRDFLKPFGVGLLIALVIAIVIFLRTGIDATTEAVVRSIGLLLFYGFLLWRLFKDNRGNRVIQCGSITLMVFFVMLALAMLPHVPIDYVAWLGPAVFLLCMLTMFFLFQQGYRAIRNRKIRKKSTAI